MRYVCLAIGAEAIAWMSAQELYNGYGDTGLIMDRLDYCRLSFGRFVVRDAAGCERPVSLATVGGVMAVGIPDFQPGAVLSGAEWVWHPGGVVWAEVLQSLPSDTLLAAYDCHF